MHRHVIALTILFAYVCSTAISAPFARARYRVLPGEHRGSQPFNVVEFTYGPPSPVGEKSSCSWQLAAFQEDAPNAVPLFQLRAATTRDPLADPGPRKRPLEFLHYQLRVPKSGPPLEYRDVHSRKASIPAWGDFTRHFVPRPAKGTRRQKGVPNTCEYLGHVLTLRGISEKTSWTEWDDVKVLELDRELLVGTGRVFKDAEGRRLPQTPKRQNYTYIPWTPADYRTMIDSGMTLLGVVPEMKESIKREPIFYRGGASLVDYPADLYRSNYVGPKMFMDEPTCIMVGDKTVHTTLKYFTDAAALITKRVRSIYLPGAYSLEAQLKTRGVSFGDMRLAQLDYASWETRYETAFYQLAGGAAGFVHEGRYQLDEFNAFAKASTGVDRKYTAKEMFQYTYAFLRGAARHFGKDWGTSIYGQADPAITPLAVTLAYDMGARYIWFWTSDHDHHLPFKEQLELARVLKKHAKENPRSSIRGPRPTLDKAIVIPFGYFLVLESPTGRKYHGDLWWVRELDREGKNASSRRYRRLMQRAFTEVQKSLDAGESFDFTVDDGKEITGYRKVVRLRDD